MWKKGLTIIILSGALLVGCNNGTDSNNNETPKQNVRDEVDKNNEYNNEENTNTNQKENSVEDVEREADGDETQVEIIEEFNRENDVAE